MTLTPATMALTPYLSVSPAGDAIDWYSLVFGATLEGEPYVMDDGRVGHAELAVGDARFYLADQLDGVDAAPPDPERGAAVSLSLNLPDVDAVADRARKHGARITRGPEDNPFTGRRVDFRDPFGHRWLVWAPLPE